MSVQQKLIKEINENYFKYYQETKLFPVSDKTTEDELSQLLDIIEEEDINSVVEYLLADLLFYKFYNYLSNYEVMSTTAKQYEDVRVDFEYTFKRTLRFEKNLNVLAIASLLGTLSKNSYYIGGCVRDSILGKAPKDYDFVTDASYEKLEEAFTSNGFKVQTEGKQFLVLIVSKDGEQFEIANFRKDGTYTDGRRPEAVEIGTIYDDAQRRDFTVNAGYVNVVTGALMDPNGTFIEDMNTKTLRFIGKPKDRIEEDYLRIFRFYRFASKGFKMESNSLKACREHFDTAVAKTAPERMRVEIERMI